MIELKDAKADPLMVELFNKLPPIGSTWPLDERLLWLSACEAALNLIYGPVDRVHVISIAGPPEGPERDRLLADLRKKGPGKIVLDTSPAPKTPAPETMSTAIGAALLQGDAELEVVGDETSAGIQPTDAALKAAAAPPPAAKPRDVNSTPRPFGIPTTFGMIQQVLTDKPGGLTSIELTAAIAERWWPGLTLKSIGPDISTGVTKGRLSRDTDGKLTLTKRGRDMVSADLRLKNKGEFPPAAEKAIREGAVKRGIDPDVAATVAKVESKPVAVPAAPKPAQLGSIKFEHDGRVAMLSTGREYSIAGKLRAAMGKGHVAEAFLAETVLGSNTENNRLVVRDICRNLCAPLAEAGLTIEHYPGFGLIMKEV